MTKFNPFYRLVAQSDCIVCKTHFARFVWATIHHIQGGSRKKWAVIPLCPAHHQGKRVCWNDSEPDQFSIHYQKARFREKYGHEWELFLRLRSALIIEISWPGEIEDSFISYIDSGLASKVLEQAFEGEKVPNKCEIKAPEDKSIQTQHSPKKHLLSFHRLKGWILSVTGGRYEKTRAS